MPIHQRLRVGSKITRVFLIGVKETRCCGILSAKCPVFMGLLRTDYAKLFLYDPYVKLFMNDPLISTTTVQSLELMRARRHLFLKPFEPAARRACFQVNDE